MKHQAVLLTTVEVAAVFIGFIVVFLTFVMGGQDRGKADRMHARALLTAALPLLLLPLIPLIVAAYGGSEAIAWRIFHITGIIGGGIVWTIMTWFFWNLAPEERKEVGYLHYAVSVALGMMATGFLVAGAIGLAPAANALSAILCLFVYTATALFSFCLLYTSPSPRDRTRSRMPSSA